MTSTKDMRELSNQANDLVAGEFSAGEVTAAELTAGELETASGGLVFNFKLVAVKTVSWS